MKRTKSVFLSATSGLLLSLPWLHPALGWVLFFAFVPLFIAWDLIFGHKSENGSQVLFAHSMLAFLFWNILSTWWIAYVSFSGMILISVLTALSMAGVWWLANLIRVKFSDRAGYFSLVIFWIALEFLQHRSIIPLPWLTLGNGFANSVKIIQWYEFTGVLGGSIWVLLSNILIFSALKNIFERSVLKSIKFIVSAMIVVLFPMFWSLSLYSRSIGKGTIQKVVILQPNINPYSEKFSGINPEDQVGKLLSLAESNVSDSTDLILAPETALPPLWEDSAMIRNKSLLSISALLQKYPEAQVIAGAITQRKFRKDEVVSATARRLTDGSFYDVFNSALMIGRASGIQISHKHILVSGVEKMPFQKYFSFLEKLMLNLGGTSGSLAAASELVLFSGKDGVKIGPVICFESAFGEFAGKLVKSGANLLIILTNDGWWKGSAGGWQHFGYSRIRAIETRRGIAQCANTGISGCIDQRGDVLKMTGLNTCTTLRSSLQVNDEITFYARNGDYLGRICLLLSGLIMLYSGIKNPH